MDKVLLEFFKSLDQDQLLLFSLIALTVGIITIIAMWKVFVKAGEEGWACLIPFYNSFVLVRMAKQHVGLAVGMIVLAIIPFEGYLSVVASLVSFSISVIVNISLAKLFGKSTGFGVGMALLGFIFYPILAFSDAKYEVEEEHSFQDDELLDS